MEISSQLASIVSSNSCLFEGYFLSIKVLRMDQICSIGFKSGELGGWGRKSIPFLSRYSKVAILACAGALS